MAGVEGAAGTNTVAEGQASRRTVALTDRAYNGLPVRIEAPIAAAVVGVAALAINAAGPQAVRTFVVDPNEPRGLIGAASGLALVGIKGEPKMPAVLADVPGITTVFVLLPPSTPPPEEAATPRGVKSRTPPGVPDAPLTGTAGAATDAVPVAGTPPAADARLAVAGTWAADTAALLTPTMRGECDLGAKGETAESLGVAGSVGRSRHGDSLPPPIALTQALVSAGGTQKEPGDAPAPTAPPDGGSCAATGTKVEHGSGDGCAEAPMWPSPLTTTPGGLNHPTGCLGVGTVCAPAVRVTGSLGEVAATMAAVPPAQLPPAVMRLPRGMAHPPPTVARPLRVTARDWPVEMKRAMGGCGVVATEGALLTTAAGDAAIAVGERIEEAKSGTAPPVACTTGPPGNTGSTAMAAVNGEAMSGGDAAVVVAAIATTGRGGESVRGGEGSDATEAFGGDVAA
mmetsp:Transcript_38252/g.95966  ORF Transcript_38252/g.95966 Transcript_38252/m.95966 type:complete len:456 (-) Transcript_38252:1630-2997(-)